MNNDIIELKAKDVESRLITVRGRMVLLDRDVAELYGVETKRINEAVRNNPEKFPDRYLIVLNADEKQELVENFDQFNILKHSHVLPTAFTSAEDRRDPCRSHRAQSLYRIHRD